MYKRQGQNKEIAVFYFTYSRETSILKEKYIKTHRPTAMKYGQVIEWNVFNTCLKLEVVICFRKEAVINFVKHLFLITE